MKCFKVLWFSSLVFVQLAFGHGVGEETLMCKLNKQQEVWVQIAQLQKRSKPVQVKAWQVQTQHYRYQPVQLTSEGESNCSWELYFDQQTSPGLKCAPDQLFIEYKWDGTLEIIGVVEEGFQITTRINKKGNILTSFPDLIKNL